MDLWELVEVGETFGTRMKSDGRWCKGGGLLDRGGLAGEESSRSLSGTLTMETLVTVGLLRLQALKGHWLGWERKDRC